MDSEAQVTESTRKAARTAIQKIAKTFGIEIVDIVYAKVVSVDLTARTCVVTPISGPADTTIEDVALTPDKNDGALMQPSVDSTVAVAYSTILDPFVFAWSDLDSITWKGGNYGGLIKLVDPTNANLGLLKKLNNLESKVNALQSAWSSFAAAYVPGSPSVTGLPPTVTNVAGALTPTVRSDIENTSMKHGNK